MTNKNIEENITDQTDQLDESSDSVVADEVEQVDQLDEADLISDSELSVEVEDEVVASPRQPFFKRVGGWIKRHKRLIAVLLVLISIGLIVSGILSVFVYRNAVQAREMIGSVELSGRELMDAVRQQNLPLVRERLQSFEVELVETKEWYQSFGWMGSTPLLGAYYRDGQHVFVASDHAIRSAHILVEAVEPYSDLLGFEGEDSFEGGSVDDRIKLMLQTLSVISPVFDELEQELGYANDALSKIDANRYPKRVLDYEIRSLIVMVQNYADLSTSMVSELRPVIEVLPSIAGADGQRKKYLVLFQNDNELRPTGGFLTAYAILFVEDGRVVPEKSDDIYELDKKFRNKPPIPEVLGRYLKTETRWNLRDMNLSPDFKESMDGFWSYFSQVPGEPRDVDGIIAVDTHVLENIVRLIGPVDVPGYGVFTAENDPRCDCPQIIYALSEIIDRPTPYIRENRKGIIGPMMQSILSRTYSAPRQLWPALAQTAWENIQGRHVQFYFFDEEIQAAAETIHAAGRMREVPENSDYIFIVDANLGGAKSNMFVQSDVKHVVYAPQDNAIVKQLEMTYKNPFPPSNCNLEAGELCLNGRLNNWVRVYLPAGTTIQQSLGFEEDSIKTYEEFDRVVFEGVFSLQPLNQARVRLEYTVPYTDQETYRVLIQKQGGSRDITHTFEIEGGEYVEVVNKDLSLEYAF